MNIFIDSGAFSVATRKLTITVEDYIKWIKQFKEDITIYANLDVIYKVEDTWKNQKIMEDAGLNPLPVYHVGEPIKYLYKCMEYDYFCLGGMALSPAYARTKFLDECFSIICDNKERIPKSKIHGFGLTAIELMRRYPWYSVDSTTFLNFAAYGQILVPPLIDNKWRYDQRFRIVRVSEQTSWTFNRTGLGIESTDKILVKQALQYIEEKGFKIGTSKIENNEVVIVERGLCNDSKLRTELNALYFIDFADSLPKWPWPFYKPTTQNSLFV